MEHREHTVRKNKRKDVKGVLIWEKNYWLVQFVVQRNLFCSNFHCQVGHLPVPKQYIKLISDLIQALEISVSALQSWQGAHDDDFGLALQEIDKILHQKVE